MKTVTVSLDGTKDYKSINEAFAALGNDEEPCTVKVYSGTYYERVNLKRNNVTLVGDESGKTVISASEYAFKDHEDGLKLGTFRTATFMADCDNFTAVNITFENAAGQGARVGQAIALYADGLNQKYVNCRMLGFQDTVFTAPLPPKEYQKNGFIGEKQFAPRRNSDIVFEKCRIEGNIDYIFGSAKALFDECVLFTRRREDDGVCFVTAPSTPGENEVGYVFKNCRFESDGKKGSVFLARPWREFACLSIIDSYMDESVNEIGYADWNKPHAGLRFSERGSFGPGASKERASFVKVE